MKTNDIKNQRKELKHPDGHNHIRTSISARNNFSECNRRWFLRYRTDVPATQGAKKALYIGSAVHLALEKWHTPGFKRPDDLVPFVIQCLDEVIKEEEEYSGTKVAFEPTVQEEAVIYSCFRSAKELIDTLNWKFLMVESNVRIGDYFTGKIDAIVETPEGRQLIVDYKNQAGWENLEACINDSQLRMYEAVKYDLKYEDGTAMIDTDKFIGTAKLVIRKPRLKFGTRGHGNESFEDYYERCGVETQFVFVAADEEKALEELKQHQDLNKYINRSVDIQDFPCNYKACQGIYGKCDYFDYCNQKKGAQAGFELIGEDCLHINETLSQFKPEEVSF